MRSVFRPDSIRIRSFVFLLSILIPAAAWAQPISFLTWKPSPFPIANSSAGAFVIADFNGDGKLDVVTNASQASPQQASVYTMLGNGDGTFQASQALVSSVCPATNPACGDVVLKIQVADFNRDGKPDLLLIGYKAVSILLGNGDGTFRLVHQLAGFAGESYPAVGAFTGPGKHDIVMANVPSSGFESPRLQLWRDNGDGTFQAPSDPKINGNVLGTADFNQDGRADLLVGPTDGSVQVYLSNGDGTFRQSAAFDKAGVDPATTGDLNGDGRPDFVACHPNGDPALPACAAFLGNGDGTFQEVDSPIFPLTNAQSLNLADFNGDGKLDLAIDLRVLAGNGDGTFQAPISFGDFTLVQAQAADVNGDSKPDLVANGPTGAGIIAMLNDSPGRLPVLNVVSGAYTGFAAVAGSIATAFGSNLADTTTTATGLTPPATLGGVSLNVFGSDGVSRAAQLLYVSPGQINFIVPTGTPAGSAAFNVMKPGGPAPEARVNPVGNVSTALFSADGTGTGVAAAIAVAVDANGNQTSYPVFQCTTPGFCESLPIKLSDSTTTYIEFFLTGIPNDGTVTSVGYLNGAATTGGISTPVYYLGPQGQCPGLYQANVMIPSTFHGKGATLFELEVRWNHFILDHSNTVVLEFQ